MHRTVLVSLIVFVSLSLASCKSASQINDRSTEQVNSVDQETKIYSSKGLVVSINKEQGSLYLEHEEIKGFMPAMSMDFYVKDVNLLNDLKKGDRISFKLESGKTGMAITSIQKL
jgi:Cu/Ag efflux protein CusF